MDNVLPFTIEITFPSEVNLLNGQAQCLSGCQQLIDTSSGNIDRIIVTISTSNTSALGLSSFGFKISNIRNQRYVGSSSNYVLSITPVGSSTPIIYGTGVSETTAENTL